MSAPNPAPVPPPGSDAAHKADADKYRSDLNKLHAALGDFAEVPGGFVETVCHHIRTMRAGIAQLVLSNSITMSRGAEITGLSIQQMRQWANSGQMARDAATMRPRTGAGGAADADAE